MGKIDKNRGKFYKNVFYRVLCSKYGIKIFETNFGIYYDFWYFYGNFVNKISLK